MKTVVIQMGNSDNKLSQLQWSEFILLVQKILTNTKYVKLDIHFAGGSSPEKAWQNYCFVLNCTEGDIHILQNEIKQVREKFNQDSIAFTVGETKFI